MDIHLSLKDTLTSGQCFRFTEEDGKWTVKAGVGENFKTITVKQDDLSPIYDDPFWFNYFDFATDYEGLKKEFSTISPIMKKACDYAPGIHILNQDPWEALCSFVVSQNNNIKRIMGIVERLCSFYGNGAFPQAEILCEAKVQDLEKIGLGYRAPYIIAVAKTVASNSLDFENLKTINIDKARKILISIYGIGPKVADCALLFGLHRLDCFPMDVWMKKAMATWFPNQGKEIFGPYAGVAQQYIFHYARTTGELKK
ncbi:MAG: DNA glycosylase [Sphaerochaetaceae bacterium]|nr:DNA glycosylase [Sphaerochaetaceae bacterium]